MCLYMDASWKEWQDDVWTCFSLGCLALAGTRNGKGEGNGS